MNLLRPICCALTLLLGGNALAMAHTTLRAPADLLQRVGFDQNLGAQVPLDLAFRDAHGTTLRLRAWLEGRPTVLVPGYYGCANLCDAVRAGVAHAVEHSGLVVGTQFNVVLVSIDQHEATAQALLAQANDGRAHPHAHVPLWHYLTGTPAASAALTHAIGFRYFFDQRDGQYDHAAGIVLLSPQGRITQYLFGVQFAPQALRLALVNASEGHIGNLVDRLLLLCCDYDPSTGRYSLLISRVMQGLGLLTALTLLTLILILRRDEWRRSADRKPS
ncbi:MAG TPA: SCO family protein [Steroidobacteraceae bacterium]